MNNCEIRLNSNIGEEIWNNSYKGSIAFKNNGFELKYLDENNSLNNVSLENNKVVINRTGETNSILIYELNKNVKQYYSTKFGNIDMFIKTDSITYKQRGNLHSLSVFYSIDLQGDKICNFNYVIRII